MNLTQFTAWARGQGRVCKTDGGFCGQCVSLINQYLSKVYGIRAGAWGNAKDWATNASVLSLFDKVAKPQAGDIGVSGATKTNAYGHIWVYTSPTTILEQNGRIALGVSTSSTYFAPIAILRRKGTNQKEIEVKIGTGDNWKWRFNRFHHQLVRNADMSPAVFKSIQGQDAWSVVESWADHPESNKLINYQVVGERATKDKWTDQIYSLQAQVKDLSTRPTKAELDKMVKEADKLAKSVAEAQVEVERLKKERSEDSVLLDEAGNWLTQLFNRIFRKEK